MRTLTLQTLITAGCIVLYSASLAAAHNIGWMYEADVPVQNQSQAARVQAAEAGFRQVLGRLTGQGDHGLSIRISGASADRQMTRFSYHSAVVDGRRQPRVKLSFNPSQTLATARNSGLPVWGASRPAVKLYLLVQEEDGAFAPLAETHPARQAMTRRAWERGLVLTFAKFNDSTVPVNAMLEEINPNRPVDPRAAVQSKAKTTPTPTTDARVEDRVIDPLTGAPKIVQPVEPPPEPFLPDIIPLETEIVLVGEIRTLPPAPDVIPGPAFRWAVGRDRDVVELPVGDAVAQGVAIVDRVTDELARRFAIPWVDPQTRTMQVKLVKSIGAYAELMRYLGRQELLSRVDLLEADAQSFAFNVTTPASADALVLVFKVDGRLLPEESSGIAGSSPAEEISPDAPPEGSAPATEVLMPAELPVFTWQN
ncbi:MAG: DUF2066 domain-containing protein [Gammaproteobacteria bacterium]|nr:DUF2066 domain-containing protein [Gammaproteobacteria bacterium]